MKWVRTMPLVGLGKSAMSALYCRGRGTRETSRGRAHRTGATAGRRQAAERRLRPDLHLEPAGVGEATRARRRGGAAQVAGARLRARALPDQRLLAAQQRAPRVAQDPPADLRRRGGDRRRRGDRPRWALRGRGRGGVRALGRALETLKSDVPVLIENTAGGTNAVARKIDALAQLWEVVASAKTDVEVGFCFDTCHAHAAGEDLSDVVERVLAIVGKIDLLHANDSRDPAGTGADRHANLGAGQIDPGALEAMIRAAGPPVVVETPDAGLAADIEFVRAALK